MITVAVDSLQRTTAESTISICKVNCAVYSGRSVSTTLNYFSNVFVKNLSGLVGLIYKVGFSFKNIELPKRSLAFT